MADNTNNEFDSFGFTDDFNFGGDNNDGFDSDPFGSSDDNSGFGDDSNGFGNDNGGFGNDNNGFDKSLNDLSNQYQEQNNANEQRGLKKQSIILIVVGAVALILVLIIASGISKRSHKQNQNTNSTQNNNTTQVSSNENVDNVMNDDNGGTNQNQQGNTQQNVVTNKVDDDFTWTIITANEEVQFNSQYTDSVFTVTNIEHKARVVDTNNNLVIITTLQGSISGLSGTYELDIPYDKGVQLVVGNTFTVHVQLGTYNGKTIVGEIKY